MEQRRFIITFDRAILVKANITAPHSVPTLRLIIDCDIKPDMDVSGMATQLVGQAVGVSVAAVQFPLIVESAENKEEESA